VKINPIGAAIKIDELAPRLALKRWLKKTFAAIPLKSLKATFEKTQSSCCLRQWALGGTASSHTPLPCCQPTTIKT